MGKAVVRVIPSKGTRLKWAAVIGVIVTIAWVISSASLLANWITVDEYGLIAVTYVDWRETMTWVLGIYAASESVIKGAEGYMNTRNTNISEG